MWSLYLFVVLPILVQCSATELKQERGTVHFCNTKYVVECHSITRRLRRGEPYKTNMTTVTRYPWGNNVTIKVVLHSGIPIEVVRVKLCEVRNTAWLAEYFKAYSNVDDCPIQPGSIGMYNMELPPKNLPPGILNLVKGKTHISFFTLVTATEEIITEMSVTVG